MFRAKPQLVLHDEEQAWNRRVLAQPVTAPQLRLWAYRDPAIVLGAGQRGLSDTAVALPLLQRQSGGGAVLTGPWLLSASIALPPDHPLALAGPIATYLAAGNAWRRVLAQCGIDACVLTPSAATALQAQRAPALSWACYGGVAPGELVVDGRKLLGLAQVCRRNGVLLAAGLLWQRPDWTQLSAALGHDHSTTAALHAVTTHCADLTATPPTLSELAGLTHAELRALIAASPPRACGATAIAARAA